MRRGEFHQIHEGPGEMVVDHIRLSGQAAKRAEGGARKGGRGDVDVTFDLGDAVMIENEGFRSRCAAERQHIGRYAMGAAPLASAWMVRSTPPNVSGQ